MGMTRDQQWQYHFKNFQANDPLGGNAWKVKIVDGVTITASENLAQVNGVTVDVGTGAAGLGTQRVAIATDSFALGHGTAAAALRVELPTDGTGRIATLDTLTNGNVGGFTTIVASTVVMSVAGVYATGDYMGTTTTPQSFASAVRTSGGTGIIKSMLISDKIVTANVAMELWIIDRTFTSPTDNAAWDLSDANMLFIQAVIPISTSGWYASSAGQVYVDTTLSIPIKVSTGTSLFYALVSRGTTPSFTSADLTITLGILQD